MNKGVVIAIVTAVVFGGGGYYFGMKSAGAQNPARGNGTFAGRTGGAGRLGGAGGGAVFGTIIAKDATSITVQMMTGTTTGSTSGTKIVLFDNSTQIGKMVSSSASDLSVGENVTASGTANSDGSITAQNIQIRPAGTGARAQQ